MLHRNSFQNGRFGGQWRCNWTKIVQKLVIIRDVLIDDHIKRHMDTWNIELCYDVNYQTTHPFASKKTTHQGIAEYRVKHSYHSESYKKSMPKLKAKLGCKDSCW